MKLHEVIVVVGSDGGELHDVCDDEDDVFPIMLQISSKTRSKSCLWFCLTPSSTALKSAISQSTNFLIKTKCLLR